MKSQIAFLLFCCFFISIHCAGNGYALDDETNEHSHYLQSYAPSVVPDRIVLTWTGDPATSQAVTWRTSTKVEEGVAEIVLAEGAADFAKDAVKQTAITSLVEHADTRAHFHTVNFTELTPATKYLYRVGNGKQWSEWSMFQTADTRPAPFTFVYFGDAQNEIKSKWSRVVRQAFRFAPESSFLLHTGDLVNTANSDKEWGQWFYSAGWINRTIGVIASPGNHEHDNGISKFWNPSFAFPENGPKGFKETAYYIDYQGARIISLNSTGNLDDQVPWLRTVLADNPNRWTMVAMHHPVFSSAKGRDNVNLRKKLQPVFDEFGVDLVLTGHDHTYARTQTIKSTNVSAGTNHVSESGTVYVVSVSGPKMYRGNPRPMFERIAEGTQLFQVISVEQDHLTFRAITATGEPYDGFTLKKKPNGRNEFISQVPDVPQLRLPTLPLKRAHSHNDYYRERPLLDALGNGFCSIEADVFLKNDQLLVGHTVLELIAERTLDELYLAPLFERFEKFDGQIYELKGQVTLMIDFKTDAEPTLDALDKALKPYEKMLTRYEDGKKVDGAVTIVISGNRPFEVLEKSDPRIVFLDGRLSDLPKKLDAKLVPMISDRWSSHFTWDGQGEMPVDELARLKGYTALVHEQGKTLRFWGVPDVENCWQVLYDAGVDHINTDKVVELGEFLRTK